MLIFGEKGKKGVKAWGPTASVEVSIPPISSIKNWVLLGMTVGAKEIVDVRQCFNDVSYIYALGNDQGRCLLELSFVIFLGRMDCQGTDGLSSIMKGLRAYSSSRISKKTSKTKITIGSFSAEGWLSGIEIGQVDPSKSVCYGDLTFIMKLPSNG